MYLEFYGLRERPFELTSNPKYLCLTNQHQEALSNLQYGLSTAKAATVLIGEAGTGKTTLIQAALSSERCRHVRAVWVNNPALTRHEFLELLARNLNLSSSASRSKTVLLEELEIALRETRGRGVITALVVDEAQSMSVELLEEVRLLANIETPAEKLLPMLLVGQPEFGVRLEQAELRQLKQRVALRCELLPLNLRETSLYVATRIAKAGGSAVRLFTREAVTAIYEHSGGIPRTISVLCDNALLHGLALGRQPVNQEIVLEVCRDFKLSHHALRPLDASHPSPAASVSPAAPAMSAVPPPAVDRRQPADASEGEEARPAGSRMFTLFGGKRW